MDIKEIKGLDDLIIIQPTDIIHSIFKELNKDVILNLENIGPLNHKEIAAIIYFHEQLERHGKYLSLCTKNKQVQTVFANYEFTIYNTLDEAVEAYKAEKDLD